MRMLLSVVAPQATDRSSRTAAVAHTDAIGRFGES